MGYYSKYKKYKEQAHSLKKQEIANQNAVQMGRAERKQGFGEGVANAEEFMGRNFQGLNPMQRRTMEERGRQGIQRDVQGYQRQLVANQGRRGIKGGAAYAQQADLARMGQQASQEMQRDVEDRNQDLILKRMAAAQAMGMGEVAQRQTDRQLDIERRDLEEERRHNRKTERRANKSFARI